jgi:hypothetical protein
MFIVWEKVGVFDPLARFGHHLRDRVAPAGIVRRFLVRGGSIAGLVNLHEDEAGRVIRLLKQRPDWSLLIGPEELLPEAVLA